MENIIRPTANGQFLVIFQGTRIAKKKDKKKAVSLLLSKLSNGANSFNK